MVVSGGHNGTVLVSALATGAPVRKPLNDHQGRPVAVSGGPPPTNGEGDHTVGVWDLASGEPIGKPFKGHQGLIDGHRMRTGKRTPAASKRLTVLVLQIACLAAEGLSNREIGQLSRRTVSTPRSRAFPKFPRVAGSEMCSHDA
ncbi:hypothetical protein [Nonomuraea sp. NEAU-A123]|uniref:hypothetical protein n=1 Tax=Nonomuraea sp. NEAU-A123 TaxID=2839649 RepID=UPI001BE3FD54|nr:hypothetical protein [Nonomuraea sp. NEAU-A123]MBT2235170.1 hypothetical protein [Nonomuraea sp. NEAU-A123]